MGGGGDTVESPVIGHPWQMNLVLVCGWDQDKVFAYGKCPKLNLQFEKQKWFFWERRISASADLNRRAI